MPDFDSNGKRLWTSIAAGALGGLVGSFAMNQFQSLVSAASKALADQEENEQSSNQGDDATVKTANAISETLFSHELTDDEKKWAGPAVHYTFGTVLGMLYGMLAETIPATRFGAGTAYGAAVWLGADEIAVPAFGLSQPATETSLPSHAIALASHLVFGVTTGLIRKLILLIK